MCAIAKRAFFLSLVIFFFASSAMADGEDELACLSPCGDGKVLVGFDDGNNASCVCVDTGNGMEEAPVPEGLGEGVELD